MKNIDTDKMGNLLKIIEKHASNTYHPDIVEGVGSFFAEITLPKIGNLNLVTSTDGIGSKLEIYKRLKNYHGIGYDLVAMVFNDIICSRAYPFFMLDYYSFKSFDEQRDTQIFEGLSAACKYAGASLIGGESAQLFTHENDNFEIVGFGVGLVESGFVNEPIKKGDYVVGLKSNGFHCNGFTAINHFLQTNGFDLLYTYSEEAGDLVGNALIKPTKIYVKDVHRILADHKNKIKGMANITGDGYFTNIRRILPKNLDVNLTLKLENIPGIMQWYYNKSKCNKYDMAKVFNMGVGFAMITDIETATKITEKYSSAFLAGKVSNKIDDSCDGGVISIE